MEILITHSTLSPLHSLFSGRNSPSNEPWPDVLGVTVIFLVTGMFMLGLEHSKAFSLIMTLAMLGLNVLLSIVSWWRKDLKSWQELWLQPNGLESVCEMIIDPFLIFLI